MVGVISSGEFIKDWVPGKLSDWEGDLLPAWFDHPMEGLSKRQVHLPSIWKPKWNRWSLIYWTWADWSVLRSILITSSNDKHNSFNSEDDFRSSYRNISHQQQFVGELNSPGRSHYTKHWYSWVEAIHYAILCLLVCSFTERSVVLHFRWTNQSCTLDMLIDKKSEGFKNIEAKLANEVELLFLSRRLLDYLLYALAYRVFSKWLC